MICSRSCENCWTFLWECFAGFCPCGFIVRCICWLCCFPSGYHSMILSRKSIWFVCIICYCFCLASLLVGFSPRSLGRSHPREGPLSRAFWAWGTVDTGEGGWKRWSHVEVRKGQVQAADCISNFHHYTWAPLPERWNYLSMSAQHFVAFLLFPVAFGILAATFDPFKTDINDFFGSIIWPLWSVFSRRVIGRCFQ